MSISRAILRGSLLLLALAPLAAAQDSFTVQLETPLSAVNNHRGDSVRASVVTPAAFRGDMLTGQITETKASRNQSSLQFQFLGMLHQGVNVPVAATVTSVSNSQGQAGMDEQNRPFAASNPAPVESNARQRIGSSLGGILGGRPGGAVSDASNTPNGQPIPSIHIAASTANIELAVGSTLGLSVRATGRQSLSNLTPNTATAGGGAAMSGGGAPAGAMTPGSPSGAMAGGGGGYTVQQAPPTSADGAAPAAAAPGGASAQPQFSTVRIDFVSGERTIFFDDFSDMADDEPPPHWKVRGNPVELRRAPGIRELYAKDSVQMESPKFAGTPDFTFELDFTGQGQTDWRFLDKDDHQVISTMVRGEPDGHTVNFSIDAEGSGGLGSGTLEVKDLNQPVHFAMWVQRGRVRGYVNGTRLLDVNQVNEPAPDRITASISGYRPNGIRSVRVAEAAPDFSTVIGNTGKYVSHGIFFDTDSDHLKPESAPVLKMVAAALDKNPNLKLEIDGFTDSVGNADHNVDLSMRRAQAVMSVLVSQFSVDASRLTSNGFGANKPVASNDTPDGRAQNRRVEFVKM